MNPSAVSPARIMATATQYWPSALLLNAIKLDLFSLIPRAGAGAAEIAARGGFSPRHLELMLEALTAHEFLEKREGRFFPAADAALFLDRASPAFLGHSLGFALDLYGPWGNLHETVRSGRPAAGPDLHLGGDPQRTRNFVRAMHERALAIGPALIAAFDLAGCSRLLDLGGGPGTLSLLLTRKFPGLRATVLDLPDVAAEARLLLAGQPGGERVDVAAGSYLEDFPPDLGTGAFDAVLLSGQMHQESPEDCGRILARAAARLRPGGRFFLVDIMTGDEGPASRFAALFGLTMCLTRPNGGVHARASMRRSLEQAGLRIEAEGEVPLEYPYAYFAGTRPRG